jgi:putative DNA primase/helicase
MDGEGGKLLLRCFAGCEFGDIMDALKHRGLHNDNRVQRRDAPRIVTKIEPDEIALDIWRLSEPIEGTSAEEYLWRRGITLKLPSLGYYRGSLVAAVHQPYGGITAIQKTPIKADLHRGHRTTKGPLGNGAVRLGAAQRIMGIAEGVETALSAMMLTGMSIWACLGSKRMHQVELPPLVEHVHIFADNDIPGFEAAHRTRDVHHALGRDVTIRRPPPEFSGTISLWPMPTHGRGKEHERYSH